MTDTTRPIKFDIGDPIEVESISFYAGQSSTRWAPATVTHVDPLGVCYSNHERHFLHSGIKVRIPELLSDET